MLATENLTIYLHKGAEKIKVIDSLSLLIADGAITALVGESGCGKSLTAKAILGILPTGFTAQGHIFWNGRDLLSLSDKELSNVRGCNISMIFQEAMTALNPVLTVGFQSAEPLCRHLGMTKEQAKNNVLKLFKDVGISAAETRYSEYPHQLSGGMRQRVMIAAALACHPKILIADEPTTALDVTIQNQILRLLQQQVKERKMGLLLITHDLGVAANMADYIGVMYAGRLVEYARKEDIFYSPLHPYTQGLMRCTVEFSSVNSKHLPVIEGAIPLPGSVKSGCVFRSRCQHTIQKCYEERPALCGDNHKVACCLFQK